MGRSSEPKVNDGPSTSLTNASLETAPRTSVTYRDLRGKLEAIPGADVVRFERFDDQYVRAEFGVRFSALRWSDGDPRAEDEIIAAVRAVKEVLEPHKFNSIRYGEKGWVDAQQRKDGDASLAGSSNASLHEMADTPMPITALSPEGWGFCQHCGEHGIAPGDEGCSVCPRL